MINFIVHNAKFKVGEQVDTFHVIAALPFEGDVSTFGEDDSVDFPRIEWKKNRISFEYQGKMFHISLNDFEPLGVEELQYWCIEDFDDAEIDFFRNQIIFTYTTIHPLPEVC